MSNFFHRLMQGALKTGPGRWLGVRLERSLRWHLARVDEDLAHRISPDLTVRSGPFAGLRYPNPQAAGSALLPKLSGSYEAALHGTIERLARQPYRTIINVGCGEGYYAVGLARRLPEAQTIAYDADERAVALCRQLAELNGVAGRIELRGACTPEELRALQLPSPVLIVCDCETYEYVLLRPEHVPFARWDALVELHDGSPGRPRDVELTGRFAPTHDVTLLEDAPRRPMDFPSLAGLSAAEQRIAVEESRPFNMHWLLLEQKEEVGG